MSRTLIGTVLGGRFEITAFIAQGGMGAVYQANQRPLDRTVAVKVLQARPEEEEQFREQFFFEACHCARLSHPNIVTSYDLSLIHI